tara:strand:- start:17500 stop:18273 length:774 start_codon:yes stop_codon:yes gene_type:complete
MEKFFNSKIVSTILIVVVLFLLVSWGINKYLGLKADLRISEQNATALKDSVRVSKNKIGVLEFSKQTLVAKNASDLKGLNSELASLAKNFTGKIHELSNLVADIKGDTIVVANTSLVNLPNNTSGFKWDYNEVFDNENSRTLAGITKFKFDSINNFIEPLETIITTDNIKFNITQGLRTTEDGKVEMFASSRYPNFDATELNSVMISPSTHPALKKFTAKKRFHLSVYGGYGATADLKNNAVVLGPQVGGGVSYTIW